MDARLKTISRIMLTEEVGEGEVVIGNTFRDYSSLQQADLLQDWIDKLQDMYDSVTGGDFLSDLGGTAINEPPASGEIH